MRAHLTILVASALVVTACGDRAEVTALDEENSQLREQIESLEQTLAERDQQLANAVQERESIEAAFKKESNEVISELRQRIVRMDAIDAETASKNLELKNALKSIEATEAHYAKIKEEAFGKVERLKEIMETYDPEWAFVNYDETAKRLVQISLDQELKIAELELELAQLKNQDGD